MDSVELIGRLIVSLGVVIGLIFFIAKRARGSAKRKIRTDRLIDVLGRQSLSRTASVAVVRVGGQGLVLGITEGRISVLTELPLETVAASAAPASPRSRSAATAPTATTGALGQDTSWMGDDTLRAFATEEEILAAARSVRSAPTDGTFLPPSHDVPSTNGVLAGSALSPATWKQTLGALREMTVRKG